MPHRTPRQWRGNRPIIHSDPSDDEHSEGAPDPQLSPGGVRDARDRRTATSRGKRPVPSDYATIDEVSDAEPVTDVSLEPGEVALIVPATYERMWPKLCAWDPPGSAPPGNVKLSLGFLLTCLHQDETDEDIERLVDALTTTLVLFPKKAGHSPTACHSGFSNDDFERRHLLQPLLNHLTGRTPVSERRSECPLCSDSLIGRERLQGNKECAKSIGLLIAKHFLAAHRQLFCPLETFVEWLKGERQRRVKLKECWNNCLSSRRNSARFVWLRPHILSSELCLRAAGQWKLLLNSFQVRVAPKVGAGSRGGARARTQALKCPVQDCDFTRASTATDLVNHLCKAHAADVADACADSQKPSGEDHDLFRLPDTTHDDTAALFEMAAAMLEVPGTRQKVKECLRENEIVPGAVQASASLMLSRLWQDEPVEQVGRLIETLAATFVRFAEDDPFKIELRVPPSLASSMICISPLVYHYWDMNNARLVKVTECFHPRCTNFDLSPLASSRSGARRSVQIAAHVALHFLKEHTDLFMTSDDHRQWIEEVRGNDVYRSMFWKDRLPKRSKAVLSRFELLVPDPFSSMLRLDVCGCRPGLLRSFRESTTRFQAQSGGGIHQMEQVFLCPVNGCEGTATGRIQLLVHMSEVHARECEELAKSKARDHVISYCPKRSSSSSDGTGAVCSPSPFSATSPPRKSLIVRLPLPSQDTSPPPPKRTRRSRAAAEAAPANYFAPPPGWEECDS